MTIPNRSDVLLTPARNFTVLIQGYMTVLRSNYHGPSYITGFNKCCRGSYQRWGKEELLRCFHVPQEVNLYKEQRPQKKPVDVPPGFQRGPSMGNSGL